MTVPAVAASAAACPAKQRRKPVGSRSATGPAPRPTPADTACASTVVLKKPRGMTTTPPSLTGSHSWSRSGSKPTSKPGGHLVVCFDDDVAQPAARAHLDVVAENAARHFGARRRCWRPAAGCSVRPGPSARSTPCIDSARRPFAARGIERRGVAADRPATRLHVEPRRPVRRAPAYPSGPQNRHRACRRHASNGRRSRPGRPSIRLVVKS